MLFSNFLSLGLRCKAIQNCDIQQRDYCHILSLLLAPLFIGGKKCSGSMPSSPLPTLLQSPYTLTDHFYPCCFKVFPNHEIQKVRNSSREIHLDFSRMNLISLFAAHNSKFSGVLYITSPSLWLFPAPSHSVTFALFATLYVLAHLLRH